MIILLPILFLMLACLVMLTLRLVRPTFSLHWLIAVPAAFIAWLLVVFSRLRIPLELPLVVWQPIELFPISPALLLDSTSWPIALALITLTLSTLLTDVARAGHLLGENLSEDQQTYSQMSQPPGWTAWASSLSLASIGLLALLAENILTLLLTLSALDLVQLLIELRFADQSGERERIIIAYTARLAGLVGVIWAGMLAFSTGLSMKLNDLTPQVSVFLMASAGLRLGALLVNPQPPMELVRRQRGLGSLISLAPAAVNVLLLARSAQAGAPAEAYPYLLALAGFVALYSSFSWLIEENEAEGQFYWVAGFGSLVLVSAVNQSPQASLAWGLALLLPGGLLFLYSGRRRWLLIFQAVGWLGISSLPFTPAWQGVWMYISPFKPFMVIFLIAHALLISGAVRHALRTNPILTATAGERWVWIIYPLGLVLLPLVHLAVAMGTLFQTADSNGLKQPGYLESWPAAVSLALSGLMIFLAKTRFAGRRTSTALPIHTALRSFFSLEWLYRLLWNLYRWSRKIFFLLATLLEGPAGILWALVLLTLLLTMLTQFTAATSTAGG
ncbi:MAG: hypothetical protein JXB15_08255 [Anaerolineales bacterium]|nr:hypothetical protein [Anaerolineales bacterium]